MRRVTESRLTGQAARPARAGLRVGSADLCSSRFRHAAGPAHAYRYGLWSMVYDLWSIDHRPMVYMPRARVPFPVRHRHHGPPHPLQQRRPAASSDPLCVQQSSSVRGFVDNCAGIIAFTTALVKTMIPRVESWIQCLLVPCALPPKPYSSMAQTIVWPTHTHRFAQLSTVGNGRACRRLTRTLATCLQVNADLSTRRICHS